ncbi:MAG: phospholipase D-like domain-containing protein [Steroidobacteraceae bacterium]
MLSPVFEPKPSLLREGDTCWKVSTARRATLLIDGEEYFNALRSTLLKARKQILIAGWDFDTRTQLPAYGPPESELRTAPTELGELLGYLTRTRPGIEIHVMRWDFHLIYWRDRQFTTQRRLEKLGVRFHSDGAHAFFGCVHHKVVLIDDAIAFCGGMDLTHKRWDTSGHDPQDGRRCDHKGTKYTPVHDTQLCVTGPIVAILGEYLRDCWHVSTGSCPAPLKDSTTLWPDDLRIDFSNIRVGLSRTLPPRGVQPVVREVERLYLAALSGTQRELYVENQYFTSTVIAQAIADQCRRVPQLQGLLVGCARPKTFFETHTMGYGRTNFYDVLASSPAHERVPLVAALDSSGQGINVHSKLAIFDDRLLTVGSANLNRRSMGFDVECNLVLEARNEGQRRRVRSLRNRLLAEHLDLPLDEVPFAVRQHGLAGLPAAIQRRRKLMHVQMNEPKPKLGPVLVPFFDREHPWQSLLSPAQRDTILSWQSAVVLLTVALAAALLGHSVLSDEEATLASLQRLMMMLGSG